MFGLPLILFQDGTESVILFNFFIWKLPFSPFHKLLLIRPMSCIWFAVITMCLTPTNVAILKGRDSPQIMGEQHSNLFPPPPKLIFLTTL